jgi:hypothetical protein
VKVGSQATGYHQAAGQHLVDLGSGHAHVDSARGHRQYICNILYGALQEVHLLDVVQVQALPLKPVPRSHRALPLELAQLRVRGDREVHDPILDVEAVVEFIHSKAFACCIVT